MKTNGSNGHNGHHLPVTGIPPVEVEVVVEDLTAPSPTPTPGLVACGDCGELAAPRGDRLTVHYPKGSRRPCVKSWPPKPVTVKK